jgi:hypothetical protein
MCPAQPIKHPLLWLKGCTKRRGVPRDPLVPPLPPPCSLMSWAFSRVSESPPCCSIQPRGSFAMPRKNDRDIPWHHPYSIELSLWNNRPQTRRCPPQAEICSASVFRKVILCMLICLTYDGTFIHPRSPNKCRNNNRSVQF